MVKEWADMLLFANYKTLVVNVDGQGATKGKNKATGGMRVMYASHHPCWDAKNRFGLPDEMPFDYGQIGHLVRDLTAGREEQPSTAPVSSAEPMQPAPAQSAQEAVPGIPEALAALMAENAVQPAELQAVVARKGYFPADMPIGDYPEDFVRGVLIAAWPQVEAAVLQARAEPTPF